MLLLALLAESRSAGGVCKASCLRAGSLHLHPSHRESNPKARIAWKVLSFLLVLISHSWWQRRNAAGNDGSLAFCCHYTIYKLWLLIMQGYDMCTQISIF
jgi:hypothetical protein